MSTIDYREQMDFETALQFVDSAIFTKAGRHLSVPEETILRGTWQGMTYDQMADTSQYSVNYLMRDIGPKFWKLLSEALGEEVGKTNFRIALERRYGKPYQKGLSPMSELYQNEDPVFFDSKLGDHRGEGARENGLVETRPSKDWGEAPDISIFYGREDEVDTLKEWILTDSCRLVVLRGISGIGKTALSRKLVEELQEDFDHVIWRSLSHGPTLKELVENLLKFLYHPAYRYKGDRVSQLIDCLRSLRCLLVLDGAEAILESGQLAGRYRQGYEDFGELMRRVGEESHQSCVIVTTLENPREVSLRSGENSAVRSFMVSGLSEDRAREILKGEGLVSSKDWQGLIDNYQGNPAALKIVAKLIRELFNGNVAEFLERQTFVFGDIEELLAKSFYRLSNLEKEVLYWLAIENEPVSFSTIEKNITLPVSQGELLEVLASLGQRALLETPTQSGKSLFALQPMVMEYITNQLVEQISSTVVTRQNQRNQLLQQTEKEEESLELTPSSKKPVRLSKWFESKFELGWQSVEALLDGNPNQLTLKLRSTFHLRNENLVKRFKQLNLGTDSQDQLVALLVVIAVEADKISIRVQAQPMGEQIVLPPNLKLSLLNEKGETLRSVKSATQDNFIQLPRFRGETKERFSIAVVLEGTKLIEEFVI